MTSSTSRQRLTIERLANGGDGVGRLPDGKVCFVPLTAPGDVVDVHLVEERNSFARGRIATRVEDGPGRTTPQCPDADDCGGCNWQHLNATCQREQKETLLREHLQRFYKGDVPEIGEIVPAPTAWAYRHRCRIHIDASSYGFFAAGSNRLVTPQQCRIVEPELVPLIQDCGSALMQAGHQGSAELRCSADGYRDVLLTVTPPPDAETVRTWSQAWQADVHLVPESATATRFEQQAGACTLAAPAGTFTQVNPTLNQALVAAVVGAVVDEQEAATTDVLDLYAGIGNFALPLAAAGCRVTGVEQNSAAVDAARISAGRLPNGAASRSRFVAADVAAWLRQRPRARDVVILDPPRSGAKGVIRKAARLATRQLIYVSCDLGTLTRDLNSVHADGFRLDSVQGFDMFPQTSHLEIVACLRPQRDLTSG